MVQSAWAKLKGPASPHWRGGIDNYVPEPNTGCWLWLGGLSGSGYAHLANKAVHRLMYEREVGPIPTGLDLDHLCRQRSCINPAHLEPVTRRENLMRGPTVPARNAMKTTCRNGHPYDYVDGEGWRHCRQCRNKSAMEWYFANRSAKYTD